MILPAQLAWIALFVTAVLFLLLLLEIQRSHHRRVHSVMFDTEAFNERVRAYQFTDKEISTLEKIVRASRYENKDAVINSAKLFEEAVSDFYEFRDVLSIREGTLDVVTSLRRKLNFTASNLLEAVVSTRQFNVNDRIDLILDDGSPAKHSNILRMDERQFSIAYGEQYGNGRGLVGEKVHIRWTRPEDAVYTSVVKVLEARPGELVLSHSSSLEKQQLRRWVREIVNLPLEADFPDGESCKGILYDLSAGGILLGLPRECAPGQHIHIRFELPSFGKEDVEVEILRSIGRKNPEHPDFFSQTASFTGTFGWTQERVLQYIFEVHKAKKAENSPPKVAN